MSEHPLKWFRSGDTIASLNNVRRIELNRTFGKKPCSVSIWYIDDTDVVLYPDGTATAEEMYIKIWDFL